MTGIELHPSKPREARHTLVAWLMLLGCVALTYGGVLRVPFLFDDFDSLVLSPAIRDFASALSPEAKSGLVGRPLAALTFAFNWWWGKESVISYHVLNLAIHWLAGITWYSVVRKTLESERFDSRVRAQSHLLALIAAALWVVHPVHTESVTYISQRTESLMGLFYGATLYASIKAGWGKRRWIWTSAAWLAMLCGSWTKEVIVTAPVVVLLWDWVFSELNKTPNWERLVRYAGLWLISGYILWNHTQVEYENVGTQHGVGSLQYALHSCWSLLLYLKLSVVPHPLVFDYGLEVNGRLADRWPFLVVLIGLAALIVYGLGKKRPIAFAGAFFFGILLPVSSFVPILGQPTAEHRLYVPALAVMVVLIVSVFRLLPRSGVIAVFLLLIGGFATLTWQRNQQYQSAIVLMEDTVAKRPHNERALNNLAAQLFTEPSRWDEGVQLLNRALELRPDFVDAYTNRGTLYSFMKGKEAEALADLDRSVQMDPKKPGRWLNYGNLLAKFPDRIDHALIAYDRALALDSDLLAAIERRACLLTALPEHYDRALEANRAWLAKVPGSVRARLNLGSLLERRAGGVYEAIPLYREALDLEPENGEVHFALGSALQDVPGGRSESILLLRLALLNKPNYANAHINLGRLLVDDPTTFDQGLNHFLQAVTLEPTSIDGRYNAAMALARVPQRRHEARAQLAALLSLEPDDAEAKRLLQEISDPSS